MFEKGLKKMDFMLLKAEKVFLISTKDRKSHLLLGIMTTEDFTSSFRLTNPDPVSETTC